MKSIPAIALLLTAAAATTAAAVEPAIERPPPDPIEGDHSREVIEYTAVSKDGDKIPLGRTVRTYKPNRATFEAEVDESRKNRITDHRHVSEMVVRDEFPDRPEIVLRVHPGDEAGRRDREKQQLDREKEKRDDREKEKRADGGNRE